MTQEQMEQRFGKPVEQKPSTALIPLQEILRGRVLGFTSRMAVVCREDGLVVRERVYPADAHLGAVGE